MKKYQVILSDPPWLYRQGKSMGTNFQGAADAQYSCMDYRDICKLPVKDIADDRCILFLWATFPQLKEALAVMDAWGFSYKTVAFVWMKTNKNNGAPFFGIGYYTKSNAEVCLLGTKNNAHTLVKDNTISQIIITPKTKHSEKPKEVRDKIVQLCGDVPRIELFAREKVDGWDAVGFDIDGLDIKDSLNKIINE